MNRREEIISIIPDDSITLVEEVVDQAVFLEERLTELKALPFISVNPNNKAQQRTTPAAKQYKEFLQQYNNCIKILESVIYRGKKLEGNEQEESPLRKWFSDHADTK